MKGKEGREGDQEGEEKGRKGEKEERLVGVCSRYLLTLQKQIIFMPHSEDNTCSNHNVHDLDWDA